MLSQDILNALFAITGTLLGWWVKAMWEALKDLQKMDMQLSNKMSDIEVLVAGHYVQKTDLTVLSDAIFKKLDRIEDKLDAKVDKVKN